MFHVELYTPPVLFVKEIRISRRWYFIWIVPRGIFFCIRRIPASLRCIFHVKHFTLGVYFVPRGINVTADELSVGINSFHVEQMSVSLVNKIICISTWNIDTYWTTKSWSWISSLDISVDDMFQLLLIIFVSRGIIVCIRSSFIRFSVVITGHIPRGTVFFRFW